MKRFYILCLILVCLNVLSNRAWSEEKPLIYQVEIKKEISSTTWIYLKNGFQEASKLNAAALLIDMNTYGGLLEAADSMRTAILYSPMATVVNQTGEAMPDKYQSYMRSMIRATAEAHGKDTLVQAGDTVIRWKRDPLIAEAMVDERVAIPNLIDSGKVLTFTAHEALKHGYCDGIAQSTDEVITRYLGYTDYQTKSYEPEWTDDFRGFLLNPVVQGLLIFIIVGGIYFEMQTPGAFIIGIILLLLEIFVIPGFGVAGISGIILIIGGLTMSLINNRDLDFEGVTSADTGRAALTILLSLGCSFAILGWLSNRIGSKGPLRRLALNTDLETAVSAPKQPDLIGENGTAITVMRPSGKVRIKDKDYDGISETGFIEAGTSVRVTRVENTQIYVEES